MRKSKKVIFFSILVILSLIVCNLYLRQKQNIEQEYPRHQIDMANVYLMNEAMRYIGVDVKQYSLVSTSIRTIHEDFGLNINSWADLVKTGFYPLRVSLHETCQGGKIKISKDMSNHKIDISLDMSSTPFEIQLRKKIGEEDFKKMMSEFTGSIHYSQYPDIVTRKKIKTYVLGTEKIQQYVVEAREEFLYELQNIMGFCSRKTRVKEEDIKPMLRPYITTNIPQNKKELDLYVKWLCEIEGQNNLKDGWGGTIKLKLSGNKLIGHSRGADGNWDTQDDIIVLSG